MKRFFYKSFIKNEASLWLKSGMQFFYRVTVPVGKVPRFWLKV